MMVAELCFCAAVWLGTSVGAQGGVPDRAVSAGRDSAGVWIVESVVEKGIPPRTLSGPPVLDLSGLSSDDLFFELRDGRFGEDGSVLAAEAVRVTQFDRSGSILFTVGREGEGPGEFRGIRGIAVANPSLIVVVDSRLRRLTLIRDGVVEDARQIRGLESSRVLPWDIHGLDSLSFILGTGVSGRSLPRDRVDGRLRLPFLVFQISRDGNVVNALPPFRGAEVVWARLDGTAIFGEAPLGRRGMVAVLGENLVLSEGEGVELLILNVEGGVERIYRLTGIDLSVDGPAFDARISGRVERVPGRTRQSKFRDVLLDNLPSQRPGVSGLRVSHDGDIWVREYAVEGQREHEVWHVIGGSTGLYCGAWALPAGFSLWDIRGNEVLGVWRNALGEESARVYQWRALGAGSVCG